MYVDREGKREGSQRRWDALVADASIAGHNRKYQRSLGNDWREGCRDDSWLTLVLQNGELPCECVKARLIPTISRALTVERSLHSLLLVLPSMFSSERRV